MLKPFLELLDRQRLILCRLTRIAVDLLLLFIEAEVETGRASHSLVVAFYHGLVNGFDILELSVERCVAFEVGARLPGAGVHSRYPLGSKSGNAWRQRVHEVLELVYGPALSDDCEGGLPGQAALHTAELDDARLVVGQQLAEAGSQLELPCSQQRWDEGQGRKADDRPRSRRLYPA